MRVEFRHPELPTGKKEYHVSARDLFEATRKAYDLADADGIGWVRQAWKADVEVVVFPNE